MGNIVIGIVIGLVLATFAPHAAEASREIFDKAATYVCGEFEFCSYPER